MTTPKQLETALVLARPERKRILRELLSLPEPWSLANRNLYRKMLELEFMDTAASAGDDRVEDDVASQTFARLIFQNQGMLCEEARQEAASLAHQAVLDYKRKPSPGRQERARRRTFRDAVTCFQGGIAVTTGLVESCIICGGPLRRADAAYCSNACRQAAYRKRKQHGQPVTEALQKTIRERREMAAVLLKLGISRKQASRWVRFADIPDDEVESLRQNLPDSDPCARILALRRKAQGAVDV